LIDITLILQPSLPEIVISKYGLAVFLGLMGITFVIAGVIMKLQNRKKRDK